MDFDFDKQVNPEVVEQAALPVGYNMEFFQDEKAKKFCEEIKIKDFGKLNSEFQEAIQFVLENEKPYVCVRWGDNGAVLGLTVGRVDEDEAIAYRDWRLVLPSIQRQGIGSSMHQYEIDKLRAIGVKTVYSEAVSDAGANFLKKNSYKSAPDNWFYSDL